MRCNQCDSAYINGMFCHEHGCPNHDKEFIDGEWVKPEPEEDEEDLDDNYYQFQDEDRGGTGHGDISYSDADNGL